jgi:hypothetical protein
MEKDRLIIERTGETMLTKEDKKELLEELMLMLPDVIGNLITNHIAMLKNNKDFYLKYPDFRDKKDIVASVVEMMEDQNPNLDVGELYNKAVPEIKNRINLMKSLDMTNASKPNRDLSNLKTNNGDL